MLFRSNNRHNLSFRASAWESSVANCGFALIATSQRSLLLAMTSGGNRIQIFHMSFRAIAWESNVANCGFALIATSQHSLLLAMTSGGNRIQIFHMSFQENVVIVGIRRSEKIFAKLIAWGMCATCVFSLK